MYCILYDRMMELQYLRVSSKRLWNVMRVTFFMIRKGLISKRKLIMDMNLMMKRGKLLRKSLSNLMFHHHSLSPRHMARGSFGIQEYEFSCSNSPNPVFFHLPKRKHHYFPCINVPEVIDKDDEILTDREQVLKAVALVLPKTPDYTFNLQPDASSDVVRSPFSVRISNYSSEDENESRSSRSGQVDDEAEEFIKRFYEQLRAQSRMQLLQYQADDA